MGKIDVLMGRIAAPVLLVLVMFATVYAQSRTFTRDDVEFALELPSASWQPVSRLDVHHHVDFVYGDDETRGYLHVRKKLASPGATAAEIFGEHERLELQKLSGYVACGADEKFAATMNTSVFTYEYISHGKTMAGRIYYLKFADRLFYVLHFTGERSALAKLRDEMDSIVRSFRLIRMA